MKQFKIKSQPRKSSESQAPWQHSHRFEAGTAPILPGTVNSTDKTICPVSLSPDAMASDAVSGLACYCAITEQAELFPTSDL
jgi:hypothetical protein